VGLGVAAALGQIGEFSFVVAALGTQLGVLPSEATNGLIEVAIVSNSLNSLVYRMTSPINRWLSRRPHAWAVLNARAVSATGEKSVMVPGPLAEPEHKAVIIG